MSKTKPLLVTFLLSIIMETMTTTSPCDGWNDENFVSDESLSAFCTYEQQPQLWTRPLKRVHLCCFLSILPSLERGLVVTAANIYIYIYLELHFCQIKESKVKGMCRNTDEVITRKREGLNQTQHRQQKDFGKKAPAVYMTFGRLRIGFHAICATFALIVTITALVQPNWQVLVMLSVILNSFTAWDARNLLPQVPMKTEITPGIIAPHKEAFKRTMSIMHYANLRILEKLYSQEFKISSTNLGMYYAVCWGFGWYYFAPFSSDFQNGNTWIFVMPMFVTVISDVPAQLYGLWQQQQYQYNSTTMKLEHYLILELSALIIAFGFTLAFRGYISVRKIYFGSALYVAGLFLMVVRTNLD
jgi:hypothetical protein